MIRRATFICTEWLSQLFEFLHLKCRWILPISKTIPHPSSWNTLCLICMTPTYQTSYASLATGKRVAIPNLSNLAAVLDLSWSSKIWRTKVRTLAGNTFSTKIISSSWRHILFVLSMTMRKLDYPFVSQTIAVSPNSSTIWQTRLSFPSISINTATMAKIKSLQIKRFDHLFSKFVN